jgi:hypothetical protein
MTLARKDNFHNKGLHYQRMLVLLKDSTLIVIIRFQRFFRGCIAPWQYDRVYRNYGDFFWQYLFQFVPVIN